ncbi:MAG: ankyrin repeat domain-containing protein [Acidobacteriota bacterium]
MSRLAPHSPLAAMAYAIRPAWTLLVLVLGLTPLHAAGPDLQLVDAVRNHDVAAARSLIEKRADVNQRSGDGGTALHWAAYHDSRELVDLLLRAGARVNSTNDLGVTPLWVAASQGSRSSLTRLLDAGADPSLAPATGGTPLMLAVRDGDLASTNALLGRGADPNGVERASGQSALMWAIAERRSELVGILLKAGANVHARSKTSRRVVLLCCPTWVGDPEGTVEIDQGGLTPLLFAALNGDVACARRLLDAGAKVDELAAAGTTALVMAVHRGFAPLATLLLERGADPNAAAGGYAALHSAVLRGDQPIVRLLLARGASLNPRLATGTFLKRGSREFAFDKFLIGATPFLLASRVGDLALMRLLADAGADTTLRLEDGRSPLMVAAQGETTGAGARRGAAEPRVLEAVKLLIERGADVNAADRAGNTALHVMAAKNPAFDSVIQLLADHGAALETPNREGKTPLALALAPPPPIRGQSTTVQTVKWRADYAAWVENQGRTSTVDLLRTLSAKK